MAGDLLRSQFLTGFYDGLRFPKAFATIMEHSKVRTLSFLVFFINGVLYLGIEMVYQLITTKLLPHEHEDVETGLRSAFSLSNLFILFFSYGCSLAHFFWTLAIYMVSLVLSTIWVQQIFDYLMA